MNQYVIEMSYFDIKTLHGVLTEVSSRVTYGRYNMRSLIDTLSDTLIIDGDIISDYQKRDLRYKVVVDNHDIMDLSFACTKTIRNYGYGSLDREYHCSRLLSLLDKVQNVW